MKTTATTVEEYLSSIPEERREPMRMVRKVILESLPPGYEEAMNWGMIAYQVPLGVYPDTYNKQPLMYAALASQKNYMSLYLMSAYGDKQTWRQFEAAYRATGKRFDAGKSCVRFRKLDDLPLPLIAKAIAALGVSDFVARAKQAARPKGQEKLEAK